MRLGLLVQHSGLLALLESICRVLMRQIDFCEPPKPPSLIHRVAGFFNLLPAKSSQPPYTLREYEALLEAARASVVNLQEVIDASKQEGGDSGMLSN